MPGLQNIQDCIDQLNKILDELAAQQPATPESFGAIKQQADIWKQNTDAILLQECHNYSPESEEFFRRWNFPLQRINTTAALARKLRNARARDA